VNQPIFCQYSFLAVESDSFQEVLAIDLGQDRAKKEYWQDIFIPNAHKTKVTSH
jgi:hypothetical protein